jgi:GntR family transcriptional regulator, galactonate operon transcriptional repressor
MMQFPRIVVPENLHSRVTRVLALQVLEAEREGRDLLFPNEADLCLQLGVSRTILREAVKVLADKGMVEVRQRLGTRSRPRGSWNQLDPDILGWRAETRPDARFLRELCEVRLAIEPTAAGFAAVRASDEEIQAIDRLLEAREEWLKKLQSEVAIDASLDFHSAVVAASHNPLLEQLNRAIRGPMRTALAYTRGFRASDLIDIAAHRRLFHALERRDAMKARAEAEKIVGLAMLSIEEAVRREDKAGAGKKAQNGSPEAHPLATRRSSGKVQVPGGRGAKNGLRRTRA